MRNPYRRIRRIHPLAAMSTRPINIYPQVFWLNLEITLRRLRQNRYRRRRRMYSPLALRHRHPLHTMYATFKFQLPIRLLPRHPYDNLFHSARFVLILTHQLDFQSMPLCISHIHPIQLTRKQARLIATRSRTNLHNRRLIICWVTRQQFLFQLRIQAIYLQP